MTAICWLTVALASALPVVAARPEAALGAGAAALLAAVVQGMPVQGSSTVSGWLFAALALGWLLATVGLVLWARRGAGPATWFGVALLRFQLLIGLPLALALADRFGGGAPVAGILGTAMPFGLLAFALAALTSRIAPFRDLRAVTAVVLLVATYGGTQALLSALASAFQWSGKQNPFAAVELYLRPAATLGLLLWAGLSAFVAAPPTNTAAPAAQ